MSVFKEAYARISVRMFGFRLMVLMQDARWRTGTERRLIML